VEIQSSEATHAFYFVSLDKLPKFFFLCPLQLNIFHFLLLWAGLLLRMNHDQQHKCFLLDKSSQRVKRAEESYALRLVPCFFFYFPFGGFFRSLTRINPASRKLIHKIIDCWPVLPFE